MQAHRVITVLALSSLGLTGLGLTGLGETLAARRSGVQEPAAASEAASELGPGVQHSSSCARCHSNAEGALAMRDADGAHVAPFDLWRGSMMANSARDPIWRAVVSAEVAAVPQARAEIERTCLGCHAPMAARMGLEDHGTGTAMHLLECDSELGAIAQDGVSCTICHGISPEGLGAPASFSGEFRLDRERRLFGPHATPFTMPMRRMTGFTPTHGAHVLSSELCASCHTLETEVLDAEGTSSGERFLEQAPYLEWLNSSYFVPGPGADESAVAGPQAASCQDCHVPTRDAADRELQTRIARNPAGRDFPPVRPRSPFGRHLFVGGNTLGLAMLRDFGEQLGAQAPAEAFEATLRATREQLEQRSARIALDDVEQDGSRLSFVVQVENLTGHKLPTAHPTRRAWLRVVVSDADGHELFTSGRFDAAGRIIGAEGAPLPSEYAGALPEPHRDRITEPGQVVRYRAVMADDEGAPTHTLVRGARWWVDDRLLPAGWSGDHAEADRTAPVGVGDDADFAAGSDGAHYELELADGVSAVIDVALLYQPLSARWVAELERFETPEIVRLRELLSAVGLATETLASERHELD